MRRRQRVARGLLLRDVHLEASGGACAADDDVCTDDVCDGAGACTHPANNRVVRRSRNACTEHDNLRERRLRGNERVAPWINELDYDGAPPAARPDTEMGRDRGPHVAAT